MTAVSTPPSAAEAATPTQTWRGTALRLAFGAILTIDAVLKWLPGYRHTFVSQVPTAQGEPGWLHGWFHFWFTASSGSPNLFVDLTILAETGLAIVVVFGVARRAGYIAGAVYMLFVWGVGEAFGGPYSSGATDIGTGIIYTLVFLALLLWMPSARDERWALDRALVQRIGWWRHVAEPLG
jgi:nitrite reductase (NO-forming)